MPTCTLCGHPLAPPVHLTPRETEVLAMLLLGMSNKEIAEALYIGTDTVKYRLKSIYRKTNTHRRAALVYYAQERQIAS